MDADGQQPAVSAREGLGGMQAKVLDFVEATPGCKIREVADAFRLSHSTALYHLWSLVHLGLIERRRAGREVHHFVAGPSGLQERLQPFVRDPRKRRLVEALATLPVEHMTINQVAKATGNSFGYVRRVLVELDKAKLLRMERRAFRYQIADLSRLRDAASNQQGREDASLMLARTQRQRLRQ